MDIHLTLYTRTRRECFASLVRQSKRTLESVVERDLALHPDLIGRDSSLEEVRRLLHVVQVHKRERILRSVARWSDNFKNQVVPAVRHRHLIFMGRT